MPGDCLEEVKQCDNEVFSRDKQINPTINEFPKLAQGILKKRRTPPRLRVTTTFDTYILQEQEQKQVQGQE